MQCICNYHINTLFSLQLDKNYEKKIAINCNQPWKCHVRKEVKEAGGKAGRSPKTVSPKFVFTKHFYSLFSTFVFEPLRTKSFVERALGVWRQKNLVKTKISQTIEHPKQVDMSVVLNLFQMATHIVTMKNRRYICNMHTVIN